jgi:hypothetical protein
MDAPEKWPQILYAAASVVRQCPLPAALAEWRSAHRAGRGSEDFRLAV